MQVPQGEGCAPLLGQAESGQYILNDVDNDRIVNSTNEGK